MRENPNTGIISWFVRNPVAANLLMFIIIVAGTASWFTIKKKTFPDIETNIISVRVPYLGAAPEEVEEGVVIKIEEAIDGLEGIKEVRGNANEGMGTVRIEVEDGYVISEVMDDVKMRVDAIATFPENTEKPVIYHQKMERQVLWVTVYGKADERSLKTWAQKIRDEIAQLPEVSMVQVMGGRDYEISIEVSEDTLSRYSLTFDDVVQAVRRSSLDTPGGTIKTDAGDILLRTKGQAYTGREFSDIVLIRQENGTELKLGEITGVNDGFVESEALARFNQMDGISIQVQSVGEQNDLEISRQVEEYVTNRQMPDGMYLAAWGNTAFYLKDRMQMMFKNLALGALLVFILLTMFLRFKVAIWVILGIPLSFLGAVWLLPLPLFGNLTINLLSLFGFIMVLGIVVDDAIVIGESIYTRIRTHGHTLDNVIIGAKEVAMPATFGVLTTIAAFMPMLMISGVTGEFWMTIGLVVILSLVFSLVESKFILPAHLAHMKMPDKHHEGGWFLKLQRFFSNGLEYVAKAIYRPALAWTLKYRYTGIALFIATFFLALGLLGSGAVKVQFFPNVPSDFIQSSVTMQDGTSTAATNKAILRMEEAIVEIGREYQEKHPDQPNPVKYVLVWTQSQLSGQMVVELTKPEMRNIDAYEIVKLWREKVGEIPGSRELRFQGGTHAGGGDPIDFRLAGSNFEQLEAASNELEEKLKLYDGVFDVQNSYASGNQEIKLTLKPEAENLGLSLADLGRQVRQAFYGAEAQRIQRGKDEIRVMVRYPEGERRSLGSLNNMRIRTAAGEEIPFSSVAELEIGEGYSSILRIDGHRAVSVTGDIDTQKVEPQEVIKDLNENLLADLRSRYPDIEIGTQGASKEQAETIVELALAGLMTLFVIYTLMAIPLKSYTQPLLIMSVIPFGVIGAIVGHFIAGKAMSILSMFGIIALSGVVVNDSLILVDYINQRRHAGFELKDAVMEAGLRRFRAIILTSLTTFFGLIPIMLETSLQAKIMIPMAISLAFGILFATVITLLMVPSLYLVGQDFRLLLRRLWHWADKPAKAQKSIG